MTISREKRNRRAADRAKKDYAWYKSHGVCVQCHTNNAAKGHVLCPDCLYKSRERYRAERENETPEEHAAFRDWQNKNRRVYLKRMHEEHRCEWCGKPVKDGERLCMECGIKERRGKREYYLAHKERYAKNRVKTDFSPGLCSRCNEPALPGKKVCAKHYAISLYGLSIGRTRSPFGKYDKIMKKEIDAKKRAKEKAAHEEAAKHKNHQDHSSKETEA